MNELGVVAIGRNEGERLRRCLRSLDGRGVAYVYVDSGSTDGSVDLARSMGAEVVELDMSRPFSAARARNAGFDRLKEVVPGLRFVMFLDGDCEVAEGWLERARQELEARPRAAVVCGRRREMFPEQSVYNRLADLEWDTPIGESIACGGDSVMRAEAFEAVGGFDPTAIAGEEPELCQRLRRDGWSIWRVDAEMTRHDLAMTRFRQWWRRNYRSGYNGLDILTRFPGEDRLFVGELKRARTWGLGWPIAVIFGELAGEVVGLVWGIPALGPLMAGLVALALPLQMARLAFKIRKRVDGPRTAIAYGVLTMIAKWANLAGQFGYILDRRRGRMARLIEYNAPAQGQGASARSNVTPADARS
ncbi:glycosyltransferase family 2 protein (plasmid) [Tundrisphaera lichenicola]|uniref:glycosyltransferase family 2 protein n=1 Tax=Tundrisphaera lichenicola TaxID=2029860 RepID=UPI003EB77C7E